MDDDKANRRSTSKGKQTTRENPALAIIGDAALALVFALVTSALQIAGVPSMGIAHLLIFFAFLVSVIRVWSLESYGYTVRSRFIFIAILTVVFVATDRWMVKQRAESDMANAGPFLSVENAGPFYTVSQDKQSVPSKVSRYAKIKVTNIGKRRISNVNVVVTRVNNQDELLHHNVQLPLSSSDNQFNLPHPSAMVASTDINPGDEQYFDALVECNGYAGCPKGELAFLSIENERRRFVQLSGKGYSRIEEFTVRASGDVGAPVTKTFVLLLEPSGKLQLKSKVDEEAR